MKWQTNLLFLFCTVLFGAFSVFFIFVVIKDELAIGLFFGIFFLALTLLFLYLLIAISLKRIFIEVTSDRIIAGLPFKTVSVRWEEIKEINSYSYNSNSYISVLLKKDTDKKPKRTFTNSSNALFGVPPYSFQIPMRLFKDIDIDLMLNAMIEQKNKTKCEDNKRVEMNTKSSVEDENYLIKATLMSILISIIIGTIYGISMVKLGKNYIIIPIFCSLLIITVFNKYYIEDSFRLGIRILTGVLCSCQVPIAIITAVLLRERLSISLYSIFFIIKEYFYYLLINPTDQLFVIITLLVCFGIGAVKGRTKSNTY